MARPYKLGLSYYPLDCDFLSDEKVIAVKANCGSKGIAVMIALLCTIYRNGYYAQWNEMTSLKIANDLPGVSAEAVGKVVEILVKYNFFDKELYFSENILTSAAIQRRYFEITRRRAKVEEMPYLVVNVCNNSVNVDNNSVIAYNNPTNKTKQNKTKENPMGGSQRPEAVARSPEVEIGKILALRALEPVARLEPTVRDCEMFHAYYSARGWMIGGAPIASLAGAFITWLRRRTDHKADLKALEDQRREQALEAEARAKSERTATAADKPVASPEEIAAIMARHGYTPKGKRS